MEFYNNDVIGKQKLLGAFLQYVDSTPEERRNKFGIAELLTVTRFAYFVQPSRLEYPEMHMANLITTARNALTEEGCRAFIEILDMLGDFFWREEPGITLA